MNAKELIKALHSGKRAYGTLIISPSPKFIGAVKGMDLDFVFIDTEHIPLDSQELGWMCHGYRGIGMTPIVRIPSPDPYQACRVLDTGASGIIAPYIETVEQVQQLRGAIKLRPLKGKRLQDILSGKSEAEPELADYLKKYNEEHIMIVNIESVPAMKVLDDILDVPGLDAVLIGPHDLTTNLGIPQKYDHPLFDEAVREIIAKARAKNIGAGIHFWPSVEQEISWAKAGMNMIIHHSDMMLFKESMQDVLNQLRVALGDSAESKKLEDEAI